MQKLLCDECEAVMAVGDEAETPAKSGAGTKQCARGLVQSDRGGVSVEFVQLQIRVVTPEPHRLCGPREPSPPGGLAPSQAV